MLVVTPGRLKGALPVVAVLTEAYFASRAIAWQRGPRASFWILVLNHTVGNDVGEHEFFVRDPSGRYRLTPSGH